VGGDSIVVAQIALALALAIAVFFSDRFWGAPVSEFDRWAAGLLTAGLNGGMVLAFGPVPFWYFPMVAMLSVVSVVDRAHHIIPNRWVLGLGGCALWARASSGAWQASVGVALIVLAFFLAVHFVTQGGLGMGDVKLSGVVALALGYPATVTAIVTGLWAAGLYAVFLLVRHRSHRPKTLPLGPFLALGGLVGLVELLH
jgi:Flp pilus assembly protein protease CpaA